MERWNDLRGADGHRNNHPQGNQLTQTRDRHGGGRTQEGNNDENRGRGAGVEIRGTTQSNICFWCMQEGHHQADCTNPPFCFRCKDSGHIAARCPSSMGVSMRMYGFGFPGQGFHCLKIPGAVKQQVHEHQGLIKVEKGGNE